MPVVKVERDAGFLPKPNEVQLVLGEMAPSEALVTAAFALAFDEDRLLMAELHERGLDIPGGHVRPGESSEEAMCREVYEEAGARLGPSRPLGYLLLRLLGPCPPAWRYPYPDSYMVFYVARITALEPFTGSVDSAGRALLAPVDVQETAWARRNPELYEAGLSTIRA